MKSNSKTKKSVRKGKSSKKPVKKVAKKPVKKVAKKPVKKVAKKPVKKTTTKEKNMPQLEKKLIKLEQQIEIVTANIEKKIAMQVNQEQSSQEEQSEIPKTESIQDEQISQEYISEPQQEKSRKEKFEEYEKDYLARLDVQEQESQRVMTDKGLSKLGTMPKGWSP